MVHIELHVSCAHLFQFHDFAGEVFRMSIGVLGVITSQVKDGVGAREGWLAHEEMESKDIDSDEDDSDA